MHLHLDKKKIAVASSPLQVCHEAEQGKGDALELKRNISRWAVEPKPADRKSRPFNGSAVSVKPFTAVNESFDHVLWGRFGGRPALWLFQSACNFHAEAGLKHNTSSKFLQGDRHNALTIHMSLNIQLDVR
jgi:hypothetical protein